MEEISTLYCHFAFRRPKGTNIGYFAAALYTDYVGKNNITHITKKYSLWSDHQFITAIQSYNFVLSCISDWQARLLKSGIKQIMLVTDNSILAGWIEEPEKNKKYKPYMDKALADYRIGGRKQLEIRIGLCQTRKYEKAYKYCAERYVVNKEELELENSRLTSKGTYKIQISDQNFKKASDILEMIQEDNSEVCNIEDISAEELDVNRIFV